MGGMRTAIVALLSLASGCKQGYCMPEGDLELCRTVLLAERTDEVCGYLPEETVDECGEPRRQVYCGECCSDPASCHPPKTCGGGKLGEQRPNFCGCTPESDRDFCERYARDHTIPAALVCGSVTAPDNCEEQRTVDCGACAPPADCGGGRPGEQKDNQCGCTPESDDAFCARVATQRGIDPQVICGAVSDYDSPCGQWRTVDCSTCSEPDGCRGRCGPDGCDCRLPETCGGGGTANACGCTSEDDVFFCARHGKNCGLFSGTDNCDRERTDVDCDVNGGGCTLPETCGGGGAENVCGCNSTESDGAICNRYLRECGSIDGARDSCGRTRYVASCGTCPSYHDCGGLGETGRCVCRRPTSSEFCSSQGARVCGWASGTDRCGVSRSEHCGSCSGSMPDCNGAGRCYCDYPNSWETASYLCNRYHKDCGIVSLRNHCGNLVSVTCANHPCAPPATCTDGVCSCGPWAPTVVSSCPGGGSTTCRLNSHCVAGGCSCDPGYISFNCDGSPCSGCAWGTWWCARDTTP